MNYAVFPTQALALSASSAIWLAIQSYSATDVLASSGRQITPSVTTSWAIPWQRINDNMWVVPLHPTIIAPGQVLWATAAYQASWKVSLPMI